MNALIKIHPDPELITVFDNVSDPHDGLFVNGKFVINDSRNSRVQIYDYLYHEALKLPYFFKIRGIIEIPKTGSNSSDALCGYVRGLSVIDENKILIGTAPFSVYEVDIDKCSLGEGMVFSENVNHTCHGINRMHVKFYSFQKLVGL